MASLDDILTTQKNGVIAINGLIQANARTLGNFTSLTLTVPTLISTNSGRIVNFIVTVAGSSTGGIYNSSSLVVSASNQLVVIPNTVGIYPVGAFFLNGLVVVPGTGQSVNVTYYLGQ